MENLIDQFNSYFRGSAKVEIVGDRIAITIGNETMSISLPKAVGWSSTGEARQILEDLSGCKDDIPGVFKAMD